MVADRYALVFDSDRCFGCRGCEVACQQEHDLPPEQTWIFIRQVGPKEVEGKMHMRFVPRMCMHCHAPLCLKACPTGAIARDRRGWVLIDPQKCNGCLDCTWACPYGVIFYDPEKNLARKCDLCRERIEKGNLPSCAHHCPAKAITLLKSGEPMAKDGRRVISTGVVKIVYSWPDF